MVIFAPNRYEDAVNISITLKIEGSVIVDTRMTNENTSKRIIDYVCGATYALGGYMFELDKGLVVFSKTSLLPQICR